MKAMILAAGKGTRVRPFTYTLPKPMLPIIRKPLMEYLIELLRLHGFTDIIVNVSHLAKEIETYFGDGSRFAVQIDYSFEGRIDDEGKLIGEPLGTAGGMKRIQDFYPFFDDTFIVLCGDGLIDVDLKAAVEWHRSKDSIATVIVKSVSKDIVSNHGVVVTEEGRVKSFQSKPPLDEALSNIVDTGVYIFEPEIFKYIPSGVEYDIGSQLFPKLIEIGAPFYGLEMDFEWIDVGKTPNYWQAIHDILSGKIKNVQIPGREIAPGIYTGLNVAVDWDKVDITGPVYIGGMTRIEDGAKIVGPSMISQNCWICSGATVDNSVIFEWSRLGPGIRLIDKMVFGRYCVDKTGQTIDVQAAALDWLITDARRVPEYYTPLERQAIEELLGTNEPNY
ncbi:MAG: NDP-sugar synthase [Nostoc sp. TH1S01]|nr:NDP-sugar synthase [Nostoc sp. TH1S01]